MRKHVMALTYPPKIEPVQDGRCTQTIRRGNKVSKGDEILFHGWEGVPYRSRWNNRKRVVVNMVIPIIISADEIEYPLTWPLIKLPWEHSYHDGLAELDFIDPPTGEALRDVLFKLNDAPKEPEQYQIIRW